MRSNPEVKRQRRIVGAIIATPFLLIATHLAYQDHSVLPFLWFGILGGTYLVFFFRRAPTLSQKQVARLYPRNDSQGVFCDHVLELTDSGVVETTDAGTQTTNFRGITKIVETDEHVFIFIGTQMAHVVPKSKVVSGDIGAFITRLSENWESQHLGG